ncbi:hypothetical protein [Acinetobacter sp. YH12039]|uniref:hypothetical protein n=1 Tax=Acinetobacter sp. YH12039 TaxID=2601047 RepID=UPI0015D1DC46|nr:hypothetical protein [Acinetobacter sp. YH12039]
MNVSTDQLVKDLDENFHKMTREELLEDIAYRIQSQREMLVENWNEKKQIKFENMEMRKALEQGTKVLEKATNEMVRCETLLKQGTKSLLVWRTTSYLLGLIILILSLIIWNLNNV